MSKKGCGQVAIPTVDNTLLECDDFSYSSCIIVKEQCKKIGNLEGENLDDFIKRLCNKLSKVDNEMYDLRQQVKILKNKIDNLEGNVQ